MSKSVLVNALLMIKMVNRLYITLVWEFKGSAWGVTSILSEQLHGKAFCS